MSRGPRLLVAAAAAVAASALVGCGQAVPPVGVSPPPGAPAQEPPTSLAPRPDAADSQEPSPQEPSPTAPTVRYQPLPTASPPADPDASASPIAAPTPTPAPPAALLDLLLDPAALPPLRWSGPAGETAAAWVRLAPATRAEPGDAIPHVGIARSIGGECAVAAEAVVGGAGGAAFVSLAADPAPGGPLEVVLLRYGSGQQAAAAAIALHRMGIDCDGATAEAGALGTADGAQRATVVLTGPDASLVVEADAHGAVLVAVVHRVAPPEAVEQLLLAQRERLA